MSANDDAFRCLSIRQPWAWAICIGAKTVENRTWATHHRGTIAIHAGATKKRVADLFKQNPHLSIDAAFFRFGAIIGVADVVECAEMNESLEDNPWALGTICWTLENARMIARPIALKGKLNLFSLPDAIADDLRRQLQEPPPVLNEDITQAVLQAVQPGLADSRQEQATAYCDLGKFDDAVRLCTKSIPLAPDAPAWFHIRAYARMNLDQFAEALEDLDRAIELHPERAGAYYHRAVVKDQLGDEAGATADYEQAQSLGIDLTPSDEPSGEADEP
jgi:tetratricopeptide (TPR) repeat protein